MAIFTVKEFAELTGKKPKDIHTDATREKVVKYKDGKSVKIDTTNPINKLYLEANALEKQTITTEVKPETTTETKADKKTQSKHQKALEEKTQIDIKLKRMTLEEKELSLKKARGELIDLNQTINITSTYSDSLKRELDQNIKTFIQDICARHGIDSGRMGEYTQKVAKIINKSNNTAIEELIKQFKT